MCDYDLSGVLAQLAQAFLLLLCIFQEVREEVMAPQTQSVFFLFFSLPPPPDVTFVSYEGPFLCVDCTNIVKGFKSPSVGFTARFKYVRPAFGFQGMSQ